MAWSPIDAGSELRRRKTQPRASATGIRARNATSAARAGRAEVGTAQRQDVDEGEEQGALDDRAGSGRTSAPQAVVAKPR